MHPGPASALLRKSRQRDRKSPRKRYGGQLIQRDTALSTSRIEHEMAGRAAKGPLSIMRKIADQADQGAKSKK